MSTTYTVQVDESTTDLQILTPNDYNVALAKAVSTRGNTIVNTIFQSGAHGSGQKPTPSTTFSWSEDYAMNYSTRAPTPGATIMSAGEWQSFNLGDHYILDQNGSWEPAHTADPNNALNVTNKYQPVNMIVGLRDPASGIYNPIFFDPDQLFTQASGSYQPLELINLWWGQNQDSGTAIDKQQTPVESFTLQSSAPAYFHYDTTKGNWQEQATPFVFPPS